MLKRWRAGKEIVQALGVRKRLETAGIEAFKPRPAGDNSVKWRRPLISRRKARVARKQAILNGTYGSFEFVKGGWLPEWDEILHVRAPIVLTPPKGHKRERTRADRAASIEKNLKEMPAKIQRYKKEVEKRKPPPGIETLLKRLQQRYAK
ncbi:hypothetical protein CTAYLR_007112 [Chrysophaeum taylorii]|uniref:Large ribosomal subunit protein mL59 domain-containing protein n=1 Tax=Chrysophaeum taylorii TaxID=2483200 RepID=A0AAD7XIM4_9STRA|nr:hypothetical protein CTAYLR_007112 [Chrysophaeum taylorii]